MVQMTIAHTISNEGMPQRRVGSDAEVSDPLMWKDHGPRCTHPRCRLTRPLATSMMFSSQYRVVKGHEMHEMEVQQHI